MGAGVMCISSPSRWMLGTNPEVLTVTCRWLKFAPSGCRRRSSDRFTFT